MSLLVIANALTAVGMLFMFASMLAKKKKTVVLLQAVFMGIQTAAFAMLRSPSAVLQNLFSVIRNLLVLAGVSNVIVQTAIIAVGVVLGLYYNTQGLIGLLPVAATVINAVFVVRKDETSVPLKYSLLATSAMWIVYSLYSRNYVNAVSNAVSIGMNLFSLIQISRDRNGRNPVDYPGGQKMPERVRKGKDSREQSGSAQAEHQNNGYQE